MKKAGPVLPLLFCLWGCDAPPGKPNPENRFVAPSAVKDFGQLYAKNCAGCHGKIGKLGPAPPLNDPVFLAIVPDEELTRVISKGRKGTEMPAFAHEHGGTLTDAQVNILAKGLRHEWSKASAAKKKWPPYLAPAAKGDAEHGRALFADVCVMCHGRDGRGNASKQNAINNAALLALTSEQALRRFVITGRRDLGMPNCLSHEDGPLSDEDVNDLVAYLMTWKR